jgi:hypothetical protein
MRSEPKGGGIRIRVDRAGIAAVSALLSPEKAVDALSNYSPPGVRVAGGVQPPGRLLLAGKRRPRWPRR